MNGIMKQHEKIYKQQMDLSRMEISGGKVRLSELPDSMADGITTSGGKKLSKNPWIISYFSRTHVFDNGIALTVE